MLNRCVVFHQDAELDSWLVEGVTLNDPLHIFGEFFSNRLAHGQIVTTPKTGTSTGAGRTVFENAVIPASRISDISAKKIQASYPAPNNAGTNNGLQNNLFIPRQPTADRDNYDVKVNWNRTSAHQIWGKFSMMQASVFDLFYLGLDGAGGGDTTTSVYTVGQTWTLSPTLLLDGSVGANVMQQNFQGPDYGTNNGLDVWGIPGTQRLGRDRRRGRPISSATRACPCQHRAVVARQQRHVDAGVARRAELHDLDQPDQGGRSDTKSARASTSSG